MTLNVKVNPYLVYFKRVRMWLGQERAQLPQQAAKARGEPGVTQVAFAGHYHTAGAPATAAR